MPVLGIETSCDETGLALVEQGRVRAERLASQADMHSLFGGVVPELASREHMRVIEPLYEALMADAGLRASDLSGIAVARGPGLLGSLLVGLGFAKGLALALDLPLVGVNHLHAHLLAAGIERPISFPGLGLLVSGGHTHLYRMESPTRFRLLGRTLDDAAGEAFDKAAKAANLPYPGGKYVDELSRDAKPVPGLFPKPYVDNDNLDFSFSGLKTAFAQLIEKRPHLRLPRLAAGVAEEGGLGVPSAIRDELGAVLASLSHSIAETLRIKTERALDRMPDASCLVMAGGVAANGMLRKTMADMAERRGIDFLVPGRELCTDNASMIAYAGERLFAAGLRHDLMLDAIARGRPVPDDYRRVPENP
ncbi:O-sialoglycoprotein endopeptidase [Desulfovibrio sp. X2]|uniref:tRNA (adenosine(37)-N6)-threonylcarbamoyltransferase complex transferase subunit TsaD n=1 Tax=Desulfovibrio sp. X2 TaxID=941449 RepID=UPI00035881EC|nr:tRNA (adenosine(37)-N6)-threonylcarbamoyltransferase complex transferase subunit TsaD [Desulfovibrio sp. X2]EPR42227.1 O-sialoglycoprotein endopeptidase [Desulfovibrio sp. X2]